MSKKSDLDQYYTNPRYAEHCYKLAKPWLTESLFEPCVGEGAFYNLMPEGKRMGVDLDPKVEGIPVMNFFDFKEDLGGISVITNPPFGFACNLAIKIFNHCAVLNSPVIAFVIPKTFRKASIINRLNENYKLVLDETTPKNSFILEGEEYDVPCCFQVWIKSDEKRERFNTDSSCEDFEFCLKDGADIAIRRVGGRSGMLLDGIDYAEVSTYFLKIKGDHKQVVDRLREMDLSYERSNTAGVRSVAKYEIVTKYKEIKELC